MRVGSTLEIRTFKFYSVLYSETDDFLILRPRCNVCFIFF